MMAVALVLTLRIAPPMLPVVSARKQMSGFGGINGVVTCFATSKLSPGLIVAVTDAGSRPCATASVNAPDVAIMATAIRTMLTRFHVPFEHIRSSFRFESTQRRCSVGGAGARL